MEWFRSIIFMNKEKRLINLRHFNGNTIFSSKYMLMYFATEICKNVLFRIITNSQSLSLQNHSFLLRMIYKTMVKYVKYL